MYPIDIPNQFEYWRVSNENCDNLSFTIFISHLPHCYLKISIEQNGAPLRYLWRGGKRKELLSNMRVRKRQKTRLRRDKCSNLYWNCERRHENHVLNKFSSFWTTPLLKSRIAVCISIFFTVKFNLENLQAPRNIILKF